MDDNLSRFLVEYEISLLFIALLVSLVVYPLLEAHRPVRPQTAATLRHRWVTNFGLLAVNQLNVTWVTAAAAVAVAAWSADDGIGLLHNTEISFWAATLLTLATFELISYVFHRLLHAVPALWRIHAVHHCDTEIDFTTTFRNHPFELLVVAPFGLLAVVLIGFPAASVVLYQMIRSLVLVFAHSNIKIPPTLDQYLRLFITTPDYHRVHHHSNRDYTDSNFCPTFPIYDYLFGTARKYPHKQLADMPLGLHYLSTRKQTGFFNLLLLPFIWKRPDPAVAVRTSEA